jgi:hypothetical protein
VIARAGGQGCVQLYTEADFSAEETGRIVVAMPRRRADFAALRIHVQSSRTQQRAPNSGGKPVVETLVVCGARSRGLTGLRDAPGCRARPPVVVYSSANARDMVDTAKASGMGLVSEY